MFSRDSAGAFAEPALIGCASEAYFNIARPSRRSPARSPYTKYCPRVLLADTDTVLRPPEPVTVRNFILDTRDATLAICTPRRAGAGPDFWQVPEPVPFRHARRIERKEDE